jgi:hypothetical protein
MPLRLLRCLLRCAIALGVSLGLGWGPALATPRAAPALVLDDQRPEVDVWPALRLLADAGHTLTLEQVRQRDADFRPPDTPASNLGARHEAIWLHLPLQVTGGDGQWVLDIAYPVLTQADVYPVGNGQWCCSASWDRRNPMPCGPRPAVPMR